MNHYLIIGAVAEPGQHPGGQLKATQGLLDYAKKRSMAVDVIGTGQANFPIPPVSERLKKARTRFKKLRKMLKNNHYNGVVIFASAGFSFYEKVLMAGWARLKGIKVLLFVRSGHFMEQVKHSLLHRLLSKFLLRFPSFIGAQGNGWVSFYKSIGISACKIYNIPNWIDCPDYSFQYTDDEPLKPIVCLYVGWLVEKKGVLDVFKALKQFPGLRKYQFRFAGDGDLMLELQDIINEQQYDNVKLLGWVEPEKIIDEYKQADIFILPSYAEGLPNSLLEAMSYGLPSISTRVGGVPDVIEDQENGFLIEPGDVNALAKSIIKLAEVSVLREQFSRNAYSTIANEYSLETNCRKIFDLFEK